MTVDDAIKVYCLIGIAYFASRIIKLVRKEDGITGWQKMRKDAESVGFHNTKILAVAATFGLLHNAVAWPASLVKILFRITNNGGRSPLHRCKCQRLNTLEDYRRNEGKCPKCGELMKLEDE